MKKRFAALALLFASLASLPAQMVEVVKDANGGWRLLTDDEPLFIKGVVWSTNPPGTNFNFSLWKESDADIKTLIDRDASLMRQLGVNAVRSFNDIPPRWVEYLYERYGIYTIINDLFGRYGVTVNGRAYPATDYAVPEVRALVLADARATIEKYKDVRGVLMYLFGNENNYGLAWGAGSTIHDLDYGGSNVTERKARALYTAFEEAMKQAKEIDPNHPVGIVNGDVGYLNIITEVCVSMDVIGLNMYRGERAGADFYQRIKTQLDKPIVYAEIGADAWNAKLNREDQYSQARYVSSQWQEIYENSYGRGTANALGGCVFEWTDEWWKHNPDSQEGLEVHDTVADWSNGGFVFDYDPAGRPNMNEEWLGITSQSGMYVGKFTIKQPRAAFYALQHIWAFDPAKSPRGGANDAAFKALFDSLDLGLATARGIESSQETNVNPKWKVSNSFSFEGVQAGHKVRNAFILGDGLTAFSHNDYGAELNTTFWGKTNETMLGSLEAGATVTFRSDMSFGEPYVSVINPSKATTAPHYAIELSGGTPATADDLNLYAQARLYSAFFDWRLDNGTQVKGFYHSGHADWEGEGDFFAFVPEAYDFDSYDRWTSLAPIGVEGRYRFGLRQNEGLTVLAGPAIYNGAAPQIVGKWFQTIGPFSFSALMSQPIGYTNPKDALRAGLVDEPEGKASLWVSWAPQMAPGTSLKVDFGVLESNWQKLGDTYITNERKRGTIGFADTLSFKGRVAYSPLSYFAATLEGVYAGLVADTNGGMARMGNLLSDIGTGNRYEVKLGLAGFYGNFNLQLNALYRTPIIGPTTSDVSLAQSNPFMVHANREALKLEAVFAYDQEPGSWIWNWNNDDREGAPFASNIVFDYSLFEGATDTYGYTADDANYYGYLYFVRGLPRATGLYSLSLRTVFNPLASLRIINTFGATRGQALGDNTGKNSSLMTGFQDVLKVRYKRLVAGAGVYVNMWGPESWHVDQNFTYPLRWSAELAWSFRHTPSLLDSSDRVGFRWNGVIRDQYSPGALEYGKDSHELELFFNVGF
jgi:hypothetical protein